VKPPLVIPMHYFGPSALQRFLARTGDRYPRAFQPFAAGDAGPRQTAEIDEILVLPGD
jgi:hypothetical protein